MLEEKFSKKISVAENSLGSMELKDVKGRAEKLKYRFEKLGGESSFRKVVEKLSQPLDLFRTAEGVDAIKDGQVLFSLRGSFCELKDVSFVPEMIKRGENAGLSEQQVVDYLNNFIFLRNPEIVIHGQKINIPRNSDDTYLMYKSDVVEYPPDEDVIQHLKQIASFAKADTVGESFVISISSLPNSLLALVVLLHEIGHLNIFHSSSDALKFYQIVEIYKRVFLGKYKKQKVDLSPAEIMSVLDSERLANDFAKRNIRSYFYDLVSEDEMQILETYMELSYVDPIVEMTKR